MKLKGKRGKFKKQRVVVYCSAEIRRYELWILGLLYGIDNSVGTLTRREKKRVVVHRSDRTNRRTGKV